MEKKESNQMTNIETLENSDSLDSSNQIKIEENKMNQEIELRYDSNWAWFVTFAGVLNYIMMFGSFNAFGLFQEYYLNTMFVNESATAISWISTLSSACTLGIGLSGGPLMSKIGIRGATILGSFFSCLGLLLASYSTKVWQLMLTQGVIYGSGCSIVINITLTIPSLYFRKHKNLVIAIISSGSGFGPLVIAPVVKVSLQKYGVQWSFRILFFMSIVTSIFAIIAYKPLVDFKPIRKVIDFRLLKRPLTLYLSIGGLFAQWASRIAPIYFPASITAIGQSRSAASNTILMYSATSGISRLGTSYMARRFGPNKTLVIAMLGSCILNFGLWLPTKNITVYYVFIITAGFLGPLFFPLCPVIVARSYPIHEIPMTIGIIYFSYGVGTLIGMPLTGKILDHFGHRTSYAPVIILAGILFFIAGIVQLFQYFYCSRYMPELKNSKI
ncbi:hypothetical protein BB559_003029 [Furculomyces boomerangus]|uniref:Major facilitator superfamily (MFS) profile domain-containing protein n=1 Tax=Furculomyces boomerangus TaxID=61424 RepID=A0A2T9YPM4_9FUNG|nr:hypothetical protein BB559_003029 [Furculomyces boomerangus]